MNPTKAKLLVAAAESLREDGIAGLSARTIAARAGVNQALIFYHFGTLNDLVEASVRHAVDESADFYRDQLSVVTSLGELLALGRRLHERERELGNVAMMAQLMSGAQRDEALANAARYAMQRWTVEIEVVVRRVLARSVLGELTDPAGLARAISAGYIGLELYEGIDPPGAKTALDSLVQLGALVEVLEDLGPVTQRAVRAKLQRNLARKRRDRS
jgi:AcrR family transcriptional regulator